MEHAFSEVGLGGAGVDGIKLGFTQSKIDGGLFRPKTVIVS